MSDTKTQLATFRVEPELWEEFKAQARRNGKTASDALTDFVQNYVAAGDVLASAFPAEIDNLESRIEERVTEAIAPIRQELAELRAELRGKLRRAA
ncbi:hypothetical protein NDI37_25495 [Funiculus sociatus GB2-A5]|uniref:Uncharacterized protein n=1 Tax=Funiculus sociatus GB2-A5 TaxID=2933946 RepID=A0ABV0JXF4_9CYAN|nr:hypothetical protein [Trichocoleus sp. FACHB-6]MBD2060678.1 hypothetical protein [Trichocoleus sp. FACHB-6]